MELRDLRIGDKVKVSDKEGVFVVDSLVSSEYKDWNEGGASDFLIVVRKQNTEDRYDCIVSEVNLIKEECEYCRENGLNLVGLYDDRGDDEIHVYINGDRIYLLESIDMTKQGKNFEYEKINYCPMCGRRLKYDCEDSGVDVDPF